MPGAVLPVAARRLAGAAAVLAALPAAAAVVYVDAALAPAACTTYDPATRSCGAGTATASRALAGVGPLAPGDEVLLRGGTWSEALVPASSGAPGLPITWRAYPGEMPVIAGASLDPAVDLGGRSWLVLEGLEVRDVTAWLRAEDAHWNVIRRCRFLRATASGSRAGVKFVRATYNQVLDCALEDGNDNLQFIHSERNLAARNRLVGARHNLWDILCGDFNVIRDSYFANPLQKIGQVTDCEGVPADATPSYDSTRRNLIEGNEFATTPSSGNASPFAGIQYAGQQGLIRRNRFHDTVGPALDLTLYADEARFNTDNRIAHNVFHASDFAGVSLAPVAAGTAFAGNLFKNNVIDRSRFVANDRRWPWYVSELDGQPVQVLTGRRDGFRFEANDILGLLPDELYAVTHGQRTSATNPPPQTLAQWQAAEPGLFAANLAVDPLFTDEPGRDFHLQPGSPLIDAGAFLTSAVGAGSGTALPVADVLWFYDGYGIPGEVGDRIRLEGTADTARVVQVDTAASALVLDRALSWRDGQGVSLAYEGAAPDIGAYELCAPLPAIIARLLAVRAGVGPGAGSDVALSWQRASDASTASYDVWKVVDGDKRRIPIARRSDESPAIAAVPGCTGVAATSPACTDGGAVTAPPPLIFYQVRGACADGTEGVEHPL